MKSTPNDPTIQRSKESRSNHLGERRPNQPVGATSTPLFDRFPLDRWIVGSLGVVGDPSP
jgi:hypothetical protein